LVDQQKSNGNGNGNSNTNPVPTREKQRQNLVGRGRAVVSLKIGLTAPSWL
jgi:hypothetical protein